MVGPTEPIPAAQPAAAPAPTGIAAFIAKDAASGRAYLSPTAMTGPKGSATVEITAPALPIVSLLQARYSFTDRLEIGAGAFTLFDVFGGDCADCAGGGDGDLEAVGLLSAKAQIVRRPTGAIAAQLMVIPEAGDEGSTIWSLIGSKCFDDDCTTMGSIHLTFVPHTDHGWSESAGDYERTAVLFIPGASLVTGKKVKLVVDAGLGGDEDDTAFGAYVGLRSAHAGWSGDVGFVFGGDGDDADVLPVPLVSLTGRL